MNAGPILITYATRFSSTAEVAEAIAAALRASGLAIDVWPTAQVKTLADYEAVVLGTAIYNGKCHADAHRFLRQHQEALLRRPVAVFALGPLNGAAAARRNTRRQLEAELAQYPWLAPVAVEVFGGKFDPSKPGLGFLDRLMPASDHRDWEVVRSWTMGLPALLVRRASP